MFHPQPLIHPTYPVHQVHPVHLQPHPVHQVHPVHLQPHPAHPHHAHIQQVHLQPASTHSKDKVPKNEPVKPVEPTQPVIENSNEIAIRFVMAVFICFPFLPLCGIGYWCSQLSLNDKTRQSEHKKKIGNALFVISIMGFVGGPVGIILLCFQKIKKKFIFGPILIIFFAMVATLFSSLSYT